MRSFKTLKSTGWAGRMLGFLIPAAVAVAVAGTAVRQEAIAAVTVLTAHQYAAVTGAISPLEATLRSEDLERAGMAASELSWVEEDGILDALEDLAVSAHDRYPQAAYAALGALGRSGPGGLDRLERLAEQGGVEMNRAITQHGMTWACELVRIGLVKPQELQPLAWKLANAADRETLETLLRLQALLAEDLPRDGLSHSEALEVLAQTL
jgi:hypothetical protein